MKKQKIISAKVIKTEKDLMPILKEGINAIPIEKEITPLAEKARIGTSVIGVAFPYENVKNSLKNLEEELKKERPMKMSLNEFIDKAWNKHIGRFTDIGEINRRKNNE